MRNHWEVDDLGRSVMAVPPLARTAELAFAKAENETLLRRLHEGGVTTYLYGGNANLYNVGVDEYAELLDQLAEICPDDGWIIPSAGPDYGKARDQAAILRSRSFPLTMLLPGSFPAHPDGVERLARDFAQALGAGILLYIKTETLDPERIGRLYADGSVAAVKYAIPRSDPRDDPYLTALLTQIPAGRVMSGFGEMPAITHLRHFGLAGFTSGSVCLAPRRSREMLAACRASDWDGAERIKAEFAPFEEWRNRIDPIGVLHYALGWSGLEDMGPILPSAGPPAEDLRPAIEASARRLGPTALVPA